MKMALEIASGRLRLHFKESTQQLQIRVQGLLYYARMDWPADKLAPRVEVIHPTTGRLVVASAYGPLWELDQSTADASALWPPCL